MYWVCAISISDVCLSYHFILTYCQGSFLAIVPSISRGRVQGIRMRSAKLSKIVVIKKLTYFVCVCLYFSYIVCCDTSEIFRALEKNVVVSFKPQNPRSRLLKTNINKSYTFLLKKWNKSVMCKLA